MAKGDKNTAKGKQIVKVRKNRWADGCARVCQIYQVNPRELTHSAPWQLDYS